MRTRVTNTQVQRNGYDANQWFFDITIKKAELLDDGILSHGIGFGAEREYLLDINMEYYGKKKKNILMIDQIKKDFVRGNNYCLSVYYVPLKSTKFSIRMVLLQFGNKNIDIAESFHIVPGLLISFDLHLKENPSLNNIKMSESSPIKIPEEEVSLAIASDQSKVEILILGFNNHSWYRDDKLLKYSKKIKNEKLSAEITLTCKNENKFNLNNPMNIVERSVQKNYRCETEFSRNQSKICDLRIVLERTDCKLYPVHVTIPFPIFTFKMKLECPRDWRKITYSEEENQKQVLRLEKLRAFRRKSRETGIDFDPNELVPIYIYKATPSCAYRGHDIESVNANIHTIKGIKKQASIGYCLTCDRYYMSTQEYIEFRDRYGTMLVHLNCDSIFWNRYGLSSTESKLHFLGYHVGRSGLSSLQRQTLLKLIIETGMMGKREIIDHLIYLIGKFRDVDQKRISCQHWNEDIGFLKNYQAENQRTVDGILKYRSKL